MPLFFRFLSKKSVFILVFALLWVMSALIANRHRHLPDQLLGRPIQVEGSIASIPERKQHSQHFLLRTASIEHQPYKKLLILNWYGHSPSLHVGQLWRLNIQLAAEPSSHSKDGFNYQRWLHEKGIAASGYVKKNNNNTLLSYDPKQYFIAYIREYLFHQITQSLHHHALVPIITGVSIGERQGISPMQWQVFQRTGTAHLVAIAGLHIGFVVGIVYFLVNRFWRWIPRAALFFPAQEVALALSFFSGILYSALAGFALPTQRAMIMLSLFSLSVLCRRRITAWRTVSMACLLILLCEPFVVLSMSFYLSFFAVFIILYGLINRVGDGHKYRQLLHLQWIISLGIMPLTLFFFNQAALLSPVLNIIAIPWVGFIVIPLSLLGCLCIGLLPGVAHTCWQLALLALQPVWQLLSWCAAHPWLSWQVILQWPSLICALLAVLLILAPRGTPAKYLSIFFFLVVSFPH